MKKVLIFGTFDILHPGHVFFINKAKTFGDTVIASVARDEFVRKIKKKLPENGEQKRMKTLLERKLVDEAYLSDTEPGTYSIIKNMRPSAVCIGYDQAELYNDLTAWLKKNELKIKVIKLDSFSPEKYKSSKMGSPIVFNTEPDVIENTVFMAFDVETTGLDPVNEKIVEIGAVLFNKSGIIDTFQSLVNPGKIISDEVIKIHGITNEMVKDVDTVGNILHRFKAFAHEAVPVAHNAYFDAGFLLYDLTITGLDFMDRPVVDTLGLTKKAFPGLKSYALRNLVKHFRMEGSKFHRALSDSVYCMKLFSQCIKILKNNKGENLSVTDLDVNNGLTLSWKEVLNRHGFGAAAEAVEKKTEMEISYPVIADSYSRFKIMPYAVTIVKKEYVLAAYYNGNLELYKLKNIRI